MRTTALLFFFSGLAALLYEILWVRDLGYVLGASSSAIATVIAAYLTGLALGAWFAGRMGLGHRNGLLVYARLELCIALTAPWAPWCVRLLDRLVLDPLWPSIADTPAVAAVQFLVVLAVLLLPTALMGATLPVLCNFAAHALPRPGAVVGWLYGLNTLGGVAGCLIAGFLVIEFLGLRVSLMLAAALNLVLVIAARWLHRRSKPADPPSEVRDEPTAASDARSPLAKSLVLVAVLVTAWISIGLEILWARLVALSVGGTTYAFSLVLALFLVGLGVGAVLLAVLLKWRSFGAGLFALSQILAGLLVLCSLGWYDDFTQWTGLQLYADRESFLQRGLWSLLAASAFCLLPAIFLGFAFPLLNELWIERGQDLGRGVGLIYLFSTFGGVLGSMVTTFVLAPKLGLEQSFALLAFANVCLGGLFLLARRRQRLLSIAAAAVFGTAGWVLFQGGDSTLVPGLHRAAWDRQAVYFGASLYGDKALNKSRETLSTYDGTAASVAVFQPRGSAGREMAVNGKVDASTEGDMATQLWLAYLPQVFHPDPQDVFVLGYGAGVTAGAAARYGSRVVCAEIEQGILDASHYFSAVNFNAHDHPQVELKVGDGRALLRRSSQRYDVITTEPSNPWMAGMASLFTQEFYELCKSKMRPGGLLCQWVHIYWMGREDYRSILATVRSVFPHLAVFRTQAADETLFRLGGDTLLLASSDPLDLDYAKIEQRFREHPQVWEDLQKTSPLLASGQGWTAAYLSALLLTRGDDVERFLGENARQITDDVPFLEFSAARRMHQSEEIIRDLLAQRQTDEYGPESFFSVEQRAWLRLYRGAELLSHDQLEQAERVLQEAHELNPQQANLSLPRFICALRLNRPAATQLLQRMARTEPRALLRAATELAVHGLESKALECLQIAERRLGRSSELAVARARVLLTSGKVSEARAALEQAILLDPRNEVARKELAALKTTEPGSLVE